MRAWLIVVSLLLGCGSAKVSDAPGDTRELVGVWLDVTGPAPTSSPLDGWLVYQGFPAISDDGKWVAIVVPESDGARGYDNLHAYLHSTDGKVNEHITILEADDAPQVEPEAEEAERGPALARTLAAVRKVRARLSRHTWKPLTLLEGASAEYGEGPSAPWFTPDSGLMVYYDEPKLVVDRGTASDAFMRDASALSAAEYDVCEESARANLEPGETLDEDDYEKCPCSNPAFTREVWTDSAAQVVVVRVSFEGTDLCWEPADTWLTVTVPTQPGKVWQRTPRTPELVGLHRIWEELGVDMEALPGDTSHDDATTFHRHWASRFPNAPEVKAAATVMARTR